MVHTAIHQGAIHRLYFPEMEHFTGKQKLEPEVKYREKLVENISKTKRILGYALCACMHMLFFYPFKDSSLLPAAEVYVPLFSFFKANFYFIIICWRLNGSFSPHRLGSQQTWSFFSSPELPPAVQRGGPSALEPS
jgi:hypothetical protein